MLFWLKPHYCYKLKKNYYWVSLHLTLFYFYWGKLIATYPMVVNPGQSFQGKFTQDNQTKGIFTQDNLFRNIIHRVIQHSIMISKVIWPMINLPRLWIVMHLNVAAPGTERHCPVKFLGFLSHHQTIVYNRPSTYTVLLGNNFLVFSVFFLFL